MGKPHRSLVATLGGTRTERVGNAFRPLPEPRIVLTRDVDAVSKTMAIRCKRAAFPCSRAFDAWAAGGSRADFLFASAGAFFFRTGTYWNFDRVIAAEQSPELRGHFNSTRRRRPVALTVRTLV